MWPHIAAKHKTDVLQEGLHAGSQGGAGFAKRWWQSGRASRTALTQTSCVKGGTHSADQYPAHRHRGHAGVIPHARAADDLNEALAFSLPASHRDGLPARRPVVRRTLSCATCGSVGSRRPFLRGRPVCLGLRSGAGSYNAASKRRRVTTATCVWRPPAAPRRQSCCRR